MTDETGGRIAVGALEGVSSLSASLSASTSVDCIYQAALEALISSLPVERAAILLFDGDGVMRFKAWRGLSDAYRRAAEGHNPWRGGHGTPEAVAVADVTAEESLGPLHETLMAEGIAALAFIPLVYGTELLGKFMLYAERPHAFSPDELAFAKVVAAHIAFALEKRRLEDELRRTADELRLSAGELAVTSARLGATLNAVSDGITVQAPGGGLILANDTAAAWLGFSAVDELLAATPEEITARFEMFDDEGHPLQAARLPGRGALEGEEPPEMLVRSRLVGEDSWRFSLVKARPVRDDTGAVLFAVNVFRDVTDRQAALDALRASEARLAFLASASRRLLTTALEPRQVLEEVARLAVPELADWCTVREFSDDGHLERVAVGAHGDQPSDLYARLERYGDLLEGSPAVAELAAGRSILVAEVTPAMLEGLAVDDEHLELLKQVGLRSVMLVPLRARGRTIGSLSLAAGAGRARYGEADLSLAEELAGRVAAKVDSARLFATEHATAETLARALLPGRLPEIPGLALAARYRATGDVGGDFYDCFPLGDGTWMLVVGDVCGRGIHAAAMTGLARHTIRAAALHATSPAAVLTDVNQLLVAAASEEMAAWRNRDGNEPSFCTACLAVVTPTATGAQVVVSTAGHPLPILVRAHPEHAWQADLTEIGRPGSLLGVLSDIDLSEHTCQLGPGDALVLFTDGLTERRHEGRMFGEDRLAATLRSLKAVPAEHMVRQIENDAVSFGVTAPQDDMAVLALTVPEAISASLPTQQKSASAHAPRLIATLEAI